jgi:hypothetical protein
LLVSPQWTIAEQQLNASMREPVNNPLKFKEFADAILIHEELDHLDEAKICDPRHVVLAPFEAKHVNVAKPIRRQSRGRPN